MRALVPSLLSCVLAACGASDSGSAISPGVTPPASAPGTTPDPASGTAATPGGIYVGYYQEDPITNPEDPTIGSVYVNLPASNSSFSGDMYFTYFGCQSSNVGTISGSKTGTSLDGSWTGTVDGTHQTGSFSGSYSAAQNAWSGLYTVAGGKQHISIPSCIDYYIAPNGAFELFAVGQGAPGGFAVSVSGSNVSWTPPSGAVTTLVFVLDPAIAGSGSGNATVWQSLVPGSTGTARLGGIGLVSGHRYVVAVGSTDSSYRRLAFGNTQFTAP